MAGPTDRGGRVNWLEPFVALVLRYRLIVVLLVGGAVLWGASVAPFDWRLGWLPRDPVPADAIPDLGENQQIVFTRWPGRSPQDIEDQITYPLTAVLLGTPGVRTVRSTSMFGFSTIYVIFEEDRETYWARSRILEQLATLPPNALPEGAAPTLGPDATALGQVFWYTLEGRTDAGEAVAGFDLHTLRSIQDWQVRYALMAVEGVAEVASVGGFVKEYQVEVDPERLRQYGVELVEVYNALRLANRDVGARTVELQSAEYVVRGVGLVQDIADLEETAVGFRGGVPITLKQLGRVTEGPALRRGVLDEGGQEVVGGVVVVRQDANPLKTINAVKQKIADIAPGLPTVRLEDGTESRVTIVPFYDRTELIHETLETLSTALRDEVLLTAIVVLVLALEVWGAGLVASVLPIAILLTFVAMRLAGVNANVVALSGIAIAIGTMVDMAIVLTDNLKARAPGGDPRAIARATAEVGTALLTAVATTVVSFLPVFVMRGAEGKLFGPLAYTKTFALVAAVVVAFLWIPVAVSCRPRRAIVPQAWARWRRPLVVALAVVLSGILASKWAPLGAERRWVANFVLVAGTLAFWLGTLEFYRRRYPRVLAWCLANRRAFLALPLAVITWGLLVWMGAERLLPLPSNTWQAPPLRWVARVFPGLGREFMPPFDEGSFLFMPTTMPHASIGEAHDILRRQDLALAALPEVERAVGKIGRVESALDPAPISMVETVIQYVPEYALDERGRPQKYRYDHDATDLARKLDGTPVLAPDGAPYEVAGRYARDAAGALIPDRSGRPFRRWRPPLDPQRNPGRQAWAGTRSADDIWQAITEVTQLPGVTGAPKLQPIAARLVMLQSGMRAPMGIKIQGPDLETIEAFGLALEPIIKAVPGIAPATVFAERVVGKPYLEIHLDRRQLARHGLHVGDVQEVIELAIAGKTATRTVEGRERYAITVRYPREWRDNPAAIGRLRVPAPGGADIPLSAVADIRFERGPQAIRGEDTFLLSYVLFDRTPELSEVEAVEAVRESIERHIEAGALAVPAGVSYRFAGTFEHQVRATRTLRIIIPLALALILALLYLQFESMATSAMVFSGVAVAWAGGFIFLWLWGQPWFLNVTVLGEPLRQVLNVAPHHLSVAVWVGFLALFGIATDDGVIQATYLRQLFAERQPQTVAAIRQTAVEAGMRRIRPCLMTTATTVLALLPVLTSTGRGAGIMVPMAIPSFGGMVFALLSTLMVPVLYAAHWERQHRRA